MQIIKLDRWRDGTPFFVNIETIGIITRDDGERQNAVITFTCLAGRTGQIRVMNTPEEVVRLIKEAKNEN